MNYKIKTILKIAIPVIVIIVIIVLIRTNFLLRQIEQNLAHDFNVKIDKIEVKNFFSTITLKGVHYKNDIFYSPRISISYTPMSIVKKNIKNIRIDSIFIKAKTTGKMLTFPVTVDNFAVKYIDVSNLPSNDTLQVLGLKGSFKSQKLRVNKGAINIKLKDSISVQPIQIDKIECEALLSDTGILLNTASIKTHNSENQDFWNCKEGFYRHKT